MELLVFLGSLFFFLLLNIPIALVMVLAAISTAALRLAMRG